MNLRWILPAFALLAAGCIKEKMLVVVNGDGSGNIVLDTSLTAEAAAMMQSTAANFASAFGETNAAEAVKEELIKEDELRERASEFGEGVEFVRLKRTKDAAGEGAIAVYGFKDVTKIRLPLQKNSGAGGPGDLAEGGEAKPGQAVTFAFTPGDTKTLKINVPQEPKEKAEKAAATEKAKDAPAGAEGLEEMGKAMMGPMLQMFKGLEMSIAVQVKGEVVKSSASHRQGEKGERAMLMELKFDELMKSPKFAGIFEKSQGGDMPTTELLGLPGFTFETSPEVVIEFK